MTGGKIEGTIDMTGRRGRRRMKLLDDDKEKRGYFILKNGAGGLGHCATHPKVAGSIPDGVTGIFH